MFRKLVWLRTLHLLNAQGYMRQTVHSIQFLRFVAAALVVFFHANVAFKISYPWAVSDKFDYFASFGASGVHIFFVISGFVMFYTSFRKQNSEFSSTAFLLRRIIRIYPIYILYALCSLFLYQTLGQGHQLTVGQIISSLLLIPGYSGYLIGPGWTLSYEVYFYLCFALVMTLNPTRGLAALTLLFLISIVAGFAIDIDEPIFRVITNSLLLEFVMGAWIAYYLLSGAKIHSAVAKVMIVVGVGGFSIGFLAGYSRLPSTVVWGIPSALLVGGLVFREFGGHSLKLIEKISFLGDSSYSLYLLHVMLIDAFLYSMNLLFSVGEFEPLVICAVLTLQCCIVAILCYKLIEHPMLVILQSLARRNQLQGGMS
jgi:exopolysaccharide production protein ExoZ